MFGNILKRKQKIRLEDYSAIKTDMHSHLIPGIDDGSQSNEQSIELIKRMMELGFSKLITTPHITPGQYDNKESDIKEKHALLVQEVAKHGLEIEIGVAAEYFIEDTFIQKIEQGAPLLTFGDNYILVETAFSFKPVNFKEVLFQLRSEGYKPILAHPERYAWLHDKDMKEYYNLKDQGIHFQLNTNSVIGHYSKPVQKMACKLINDGLMDFVGSDLHKIGQLDLLQSALSDEHLYKLVESGALKNQDL